MMLTQKGKLLYISDNAAEYLGHSMVSDRFLRKKRGAVRERMRLKRFFTCIGARVVSVGKPTHSLMIPRQCPSWPIRIALRTRARARCY